LKLFRPQTGQLVRRKKKVSEPDFSKFGAKISQVTNIQSSVVSFIDEMDDTQDYDFLKRLTTAKEKAIDVSFEPIF